MWDPFTLKNKHKIESLQKYALCICSGRWSASYEELLALFELPTLASRREYLRMMTLHKLHSGHSYLPPDTLNLQPATSTCSSISNSYRIWFARTAQFQHSFWPRTLQVWNHLPYDIKIMIIHHLNAYLDICCYRLVHIHISYPLLLCVPMPVQNLL